MVIECFSAALRRRRTHGLDRVEQLGRVVDDELGAGQFGAAVRASCDRHAPQVVGMGARDVTGRIADHERPLARPRCLEPCRLAGAAAGDRRQHRAVLGVRAEAALVAREPAADPPGLELHPSDWLEVPRHERELDVVIGAQRREQLRHSAHYHAREVCRTEAGVQAAAFLADSCRSFIDPRG